jgi:long-chain acyl-CoA synthetase
VFHKRLHNYYGATECSPMIGLPDAHRDPLPRGSVGRLAPDASVRVVAPDKTDCPVGVEGEFYARAASMINRYLKDPAMTAAAVEDGWFRTGDLGWVDERGYYYITGRIKDVIFRGGSNIAPAEVEVALNAHPAVASVAVIGVPDKLYGEVPVAFVIVRGSTPPRPEDLMTHAAGSLAEFKVPRHYVFVDEFPLGKTGKVDKAALKAHWSKLQGS